MPILRSCCEREMEIKNIELGKLKSIELES